MTIISQSHGWGVYRLLEDGVWWRWRMAIARGQLNQILMFLNIIMSTVMVLMLGTYQRQFIWIYIFSMGANMSNIWCHFVFREYWIDFVFVDCASIFVSGARPCSHDIAKYVYLMYELMQCEIWWVSKFCCFSFFFFNFAPKNLASQWDPENARQILLTHGLLWLRRL